jgi:hypothetical protein
MNYTSTEKPLQSQQDGYMPSPHLSSHSSTSGSTIEEEIDDAISQIKLSNNYPTPPPPVTNSTSSTPTPKHHQETIHSFLPPPPSAPLPTDTILSPSASSDINSTPAMKPELWDVEQVAEWLTSVGLENVTFNFIGKETFQ